MRIRAILFILVLTVVLGPLAAAAQTPAYTFQTLAGVPPSPPFQPFDGLYNSGLAVDGAGVTYVYVGCALWTVTTDGQVSLFAGRQIDCARTDGSRTSARFGVIQGIAIDGSRTIYVVDYLADFVTGTWRVRRITPDGVVETVAAVGDVRIAVDPGGTVYVADDHTVSTVTAQGTLRLLAGAPGQSGSTDGIGTAARFQIIGGLAADAGAVYVSSNFTVRKVTSDGSVTTLAGMPGTRGFADGAGATARFTNYSGSIATDGSGNGYVADNGTIRAVSASGVVTTLAGTPGTTSPSVDGVGAEAVLSATAIAASADGTITFLQASYRFDSLRRMTPDRTVTTLIRANGSPGSTGGQGSAVRLTVPAALALYQGTIYAAQQDYVPFRLPAQPDGGVLAISAGGFTRFALPSTSWRVAGIAFDAGGTAYLTRSCGIVKSPKAANQNDDWAVDEWLPVAGSQIRLSEPKPGAVFVAPSVCGFANASGSGALFSSPHGIAVDPTGTLYVADTGNAVVRKLTFGGGTVTTLAGLAGSQGSDDGGGSAARFTAPWGMAIDMTGTLYVTDRSAHTVRRVTAQGVVSTIAGLAGSSGSADGVGSDARFNEPTGIAVGADGTLYVADTGNSTIRTIATDGTVNTIGGLAGATGSTDGVGTASRFSLPEGIAVDEFGTVYIADTLNHTIRVGLSTAAETPVITTQPRSAAVDAGQMAQFTASAVGRPSPSYRWQQSANSGERWTDISDSAAFSGVLTPTLTVTTTGTAGLSTRFRCVIDNVAGSTTSDAVSLIVPGVVAPATLYFNGRFDNYQSRTVVAVTGPQDVWVSFVGPSAVWTATTTAPWLTITGGSGTGVGRFTVGINPDYPLPWVGNFSGTITISAPALTTSTSVSVFLSFVAGFYMMPLVPKTLGYFDLPLENATNLRGSIAVTGWALDTIGIDRVELWRDLAAGETTIPYDGPGHPGHGKVYIGNAVFVDGSRPDVEERYSTYPFARRAGWGYLLLSHGLWNQGNGTYTLSAFAFSSDGRATALGTKTITVDNAHATQPFGTIDTPGQGETVSGTFYNFGWALTPVASPTCSVHRGTVQMAIDSGPFQPVMYGDNRTDVAAAFPGLADTNNASGAVLMDTTTLTNGLHQIGWLVTDSCGRQDGIGSRFFTVLNGAAAPARAAQEGAGAARRPSMSVGASVPGQNTRQTVPGRLDSRDPGTASRQRGSAIARWQTGPWAGVVTARIGFGPRATLEPLMPGDDGVRHVPIGQLSRVELHIGPGIEAGYLEANGTRRDLPAGSRFDPTTGVFTWMPAPGYFGTYHLVFLRDGEEIRIAVAITGGEPRH